MVTKDAYSVKQALLRRGERVCEMCERVYAEDDGHECPWGDDEMGEFDTEIIDKLFLELSQFTKASTAFELGYRKAMREVLVAKSLEEAKSAVRPWIEDHCDD